MVIQKGQASIMKINDSTLVTNELQFVPGIVLITGDYLKNEVKRKLSELVCHVPSTSLVEFQLGDWLYGCLITRSDTDYAALVYDQGLEVFFDGYISDISGVNSDVDPVTRPAQAIAQLYRENGTEFLSSLRGSYSFLILDRGKSEVILVRDRRGSRPLYYATPNASTLFVAPDLGLMTASDCDLQKINSAGACEFIMGGRFYGTQTIHEKITKLPQACSINVKQDKFHINFYWRLQFAVQENARSENDLIEECDFLFRQATRRTLGISKRPFLFLSGGIDSRLVLAQLRLQTKDIPLVSFGLDGGTNDDWHVAESIAKALNMEVLRYPIHMESFIETVKETVNWTGSLVEVIDSPSLIHMWKDLSSRYDTFFNGDECFGWKHSVSSPTQVLNRSHIFWPLQVNRVIKWLNHDKKKILIEEINDNLETIIANVTDQESNNMKDKLYYQERIANEINAFTAPKLKLYEQARPLIDEDVIDFLAKLPINLRCGKAFLRTLLERKHPELLSVELASNTSLPGPKEFSELLSNRQDVSAYIRMELTKSLNSNLAEILDLDEFTRDVEAILGNRPITPLSRGWWSRLPGMWRFVRIPESRVHPVTLMLRVLQLNIYLQSIKQN